MSTLRAITIAFVAVSLAMLPVAGAPARGLPSDGSQMSGQTDCCSHGYACSMQAMTDHAKSDHAKGHCGDHATCGGNCLCLGLAAVLSSSTGALSVLMPLVKTARVAESASSLAYIPPAPPPRL